MVIFEVYDNKHLTKTAIHKLLSVLHSALRSDGELGSTGLGTPGPIGGSPGPTGGKSSGSKKLDRIVRLNGDACENIRLKL